MKQILKFMFFSYLLRPAFTSFFVANKTFQNHKSNILPGKEISKKCGSPKTQLFFLSFARKNVLADFFVVLTVEETINRFDFIRKIFSHLQMCGNCCI